MLSFFAKKKTSPDTPPEEAIPGPEPAQNGDDFIFIERRPGNPTAPTSGPMYPPMPPAPFGMPYPGSQYAPGAQRPAATSPTAAATPIPYIQGVPFELAPQFSTTNSVDLIQMQVDHILAVMTRQMSVDEQDTYNFSVERSVQSESEAY